MTCITGLMFINILQGEGSLTESRQQEMIWKEARRQRAYNYPNLLHIRQLLYRVTHKEMFSSRNTYQLGLIHLLTILTHTYRIIIRKHNSAARPFWSIHAYRHLTVLHLPLYPKPPQTGLKPSFGFLKLPDVWSNAPGSTLGGRYSEAQNVKCKRRCGARRPSVRV